MKIVAPFAPSRINSSIESTKVPFFLKSFIFKSATEDLKYTRMSCQRWFKLEWVTSTRTNPSGRPAYRSASPPVTYSRRAARATDIVCFAAVSGNGTNETRTIVHFPLIKL